MGKLAKRDHGHVIISDPGADKPLEEFATLSCCHCGGQWRPQPGSGRVRGFCTRCMGPVCGPGCADCVPVEVLLENLEKGRPMDFRPVIVPVSLSGE